MAEYTQWGPEELVTSPLFFVAPTTSTGWAWVTDRGRENQPRVLRGNSGAYNTTLGDVIPGVAGKQLFVTVEADTSGTADIEYGVSYDQGRSVISASLSGATSVYSGYVTIPSNATNIRPYISKTGGTIYVHMVSLRVVDGKTSPHGWLSTYTMTSSAADWMISADGNTILIRDDDGNVVGSIGPNGDGTSGVTITDGPTPPVPTGITATGSYGIVTLSWDGTFVGGAARPKDLEGIEIYVSSTSFSSVGSAIYKGTLDRSTMTIPLSPGTWYVRARAKSVAGKHSGLSTQFTASAPEVSVDLSSIQSQIDAANTQIANAHTAITQTGVTLEGKLASLADDSSQYEVAFSNVRMTSAAIDEAVISRLWTDVVRSRAITTDMLTVGSGANLVRDVTMQSAPNGHWVKLSSSTVGRDGPSGAYATTIINTDGAAVYAQIAGYATGPRDQTFDVRPGTQYKLSAWVYPHTSNTEFLLSLNTYSADGTRTITNSAWQSTAANAWTLIDAVVTAPLTAVTGAIRIGVRRDSAALNSKVSMPSVVSMVDSSLVVDGGITAQNMTLVGDNLVSDPYFTQPDSTWNTRSTGVTVLSTGGRISGTGYINVPASTSQVGCYATSTASYAAPIVPGDSYRTSVWVRPTATIPAGGVSIYARRFSGSVWASTDGTINTGSNTVALAANTWTKITGAFTAEAGHRYAAIGLYVQSSVNVAVRFSEPSIKSRADATLIVDGAVHAEALNVSASGDKGRITITPDGIRGYGVGYGDTPTWELSTTNPDTYEINNTSGDSVFTASSKGVVTSLSVDTDKILLDGDNLGTTIDRMARGAVAYGSVSVAGRTCTVGKPAEDSAYIALGEIDIDIPSSTAYEFTTSQVSVYVPHGAYLTLDALYTTDGSKPTFNSSKLSAGNFAVVRPSASGTGERHLVAVSGLFERSSAGRHRILFALRTWTNATTTGTVTCYAGSNTFTVYVRDLGRRETDGNALGARTEVKNTVVSGSGSSSGGNNPAPVKSYTKTYTATAVQSYKTDGNKYSWSSGGVQMGTNYAFQGSQPSPGTGGSGMRSMWIFPNMMNDLSGATVKSVRLYLKNKHTYYGAGGSAYIFTHGWSGIQNTLSGRTTNQFVRSFSKGGSLWIPITNSVVSNIIGSTSNPLKTGSLRGFGLYTTGMGNYGYWQKDAKIEVTYEK